MCNLVMRLGIAGLLAMGMSLWASAASAEARPYRGPHPVDEEGGWHEEERIHVHESLPVGLAPFADVDGALFFLADPVAYGYSGDVWAFEGEHPLPAAVGGYCGLTELHRHQFAPEGEYERQDDGAYRFRGALRGGGHTYRPGRLAPDEPVAPPEEPPVLPAPFPMYGSFPGGACVLIDTADGGSVVYRPCAPPPRRARTRRGRAHDAGGGGDASPPPRTGARPPPAGADRRYRASPAPRPQPRRVEPPH